jgi:hypothetical protein
MAAFQVGGAVVTADDGVEVRHIHVLAVLSLVDGVYSVNLRFFLGWLPHWLVLDWYSFVF